MTFSEMMLQECGYETKTTFWDDFSMAEPFGTSAIQDTYNRAFKYWRTNIEYLTELVLVLNHKIWYWAERNETIARLYDKLWRAADGWCSENLSDEDYAYYYSVMD